MWLCLMDSLHKSLWNNAGIPSFFLAGIKVLIKVAKKNLNLILALGLLLLAKSIKKWTKGQNPKDRYEYIKRAPNEVQGISSQTDKSNLALVKVYIMIFADIVDPMCSLERHFYAKFISFYFFDVARPLKDDM